MNDIPVFFETFHVGDLEIGKRGHPSFRYDSRWQESPHAFPVSTTMPLERDLSGPDIVHPWIANLLPEERQLEAIARNLGVSRADSLGILERIGGDVAGALSFGSPVPRQEWEYVPLTEFYGEPDPGKALHRHFDDLHRRPFLVGADGVRLSLAGGQEKSVLAVIGPDGRPRPGLCEDGDRIAVPTGGAPSTLIVKPDNPRFLSGIVENEAYCLSLAAAIGIEAAEAGTLRAEDRTALAVARYDRVFAPDGTVRRLHQEDFAQALGVFPEQKYERSRLPGPSLSDILGVGGKAWSVARNVPASLPAPERDRLLDQVIFNVLVANTDAHAKNYALLLDARQPRLSPLYDVSCVLPWDHIDQNFAQKIAGKKRKPGDIAPRHWETIARDSGFNAHHVRERVEEMVDGIFRKGPEVASKVAAMPGVYPGDVGLVRDKVQDNALRILGRFPRSGRSTPERPEGDERTPPEPSRFDDLTESSGLTAKGAQEGEQQRAGRELQLACALTERIAPCPDDGELHRRLPVPVRDALAAAGKTEGVSQEAVDELAAKIARERAEADVRVELTREFSDAPLFEFKARFAGHPRFSRGDLLRPYDAAIKERIAALDRTTPVPSDLERLVARAAVASAGTGNEDTARQMVKALKFGTVPEAQDIRSRQKALLADLAQPRENDTDPGKVRLAQEIYRCFTLEETSQICEGRSPFLETLASHADRSRVTARFKALHDFEIAGPAPWAVLHRTVAETLAERNTPGERLAGRSAPTEASRFPTREV